LVAFLKLKNIAMSSAEEIKIEDDFYLIRFQNDHAETMHYERKVNSGIIQFHFQFKRERKIHF
jgi:hypothetical protein